MSPHAQNKSPGEDRFSMMLDAMAQAPSEVLPSRFWEDLNRKNLKAGMAISSVRWPRTTSPGSCRYETLS